jgi:hypothetical protein
MPERYRPVGHHAVGIRAAELHGIGHLSDRREVG